VTTLFLSFLAGLITMFNPCVLPLAPVVVAGARAEDPRAPLALAAGLAVTFGVVGGIVSGFGAEIGAIAALRVPAAIVVVLIGLVLVIPSLAHAFEEAMQRVSQRIGGSGSMSPAKGLLGQFGLGAILALVWAPCVGPTLGAAIVLASRSGTFALAVLNMMINALGAATSLLIAGYLIRRLSVGGRKLTGRSALIARTALGGLLIIVGTISATGLDERVQSVINNHLPTWFIAFVTRF
jgi:cytochrome c biogenesis protein CcdA